MIRPAVTYRGLGPQAAPWPSSGSGRIRGTPSGTPSSKRVTPQHQVQVLRQVTSADDETEPWQCHSSAVITVLSLRFCRMTLQYCFYSTVITVLQSQFRQYYYSTVWRSPVLSARRSNAYRLTLFSCYPPVIRNRSLLFLMRNRFMKNPPRIYFFRIEIE